MNENSSTLTPVVLSKKRELMSPDSPPDQKKNRFYKSPVSAGAVTEINVSHEPEDTVGDELWMDTEGATGDGDDIGTSGDKQIHVPQGSQHPNLNVTLKEGDLKGISVLLKESFRGELRDEMRLEMGIMIKGIVDGRLKGFNEKVGDELWMDTEGATGDGDDIGTSGDKQIHAPQGSQQPNLNVTLKEGDLKGISVLLKESFRGELRDEMRLEMGIMIKGIVDGRLKGFNEKVDALNVRIDSLKTENTSLKKGKDSLRTRVSKFETLLRRRSSTAAEIIFGYPAIRKGKMKIQTTSF